MTVTELCCVRLGRLGAARRPQLFVLRCPLQYEYITLLPPPPLIRLWDIVYGVHQVFHVARGVGVGVGVVGVLGIWGIM
ncbi:hypothetical protein RR46_09028 [Papilio xuthus]|uniref:Uncharacterized protein n=1 Tax=Papilio xuthus TaxID=66420 RepID=A0A194PUN8_PAPXU|nr:hypothetical protein RR46_09028 [Papilio xuthus]